MGRMHMHDPLQARSQTPSHAHHANLPRIARGTINRAQADVLRSPRAAGLHHHLGHDRRHVGPHAVGPDDRGFLRLDAALQAALHRPQLRARRRPDDAVHAGALQRRRVLRALVPNAGLPNAMDGYDETPESFTKSVKLFLDTGLVNALGVPAGAAARCDFSRLVQFSSR